MAGVESTLIDLGSPVLHCRNPFWKRDGVKGPWLCKYIFSNQIKAFLAVNVHTLPFFVLQGCNDPV